MGQIYDDAQEVYRAFETDGVPASGPNDPSKTDIIGLFQIIDSLVGGAISGAIPVDTAAHIPASTGSNKIYLVTSDATTANNGYWQDTSGGNVILTALNAALKGAPGTNGIMSAATNTDLDAGTSNTVGVTPASLTHLGLDATIAPKIGVTTASLSDWTAVTPTSSADGAYVNNAGAVTSNASYRYAIFSYTAGTRVRVTSAALQSAVYLAVYRNASNAVVGTEALGDGSTSYTNHELTSIPAGTATISINGRTTQPIVVQELLVASDIAGRLNAAEADIDSQAASLGDVTDSLSGWVAQTATASGTDSYINDAGTVATGAANEKYAKFAVAAGTTFRLTTGFVGAATHVVHYYNGSTHIGTDIAGPSTFTLYDQELTAPANTTTVGINGRMDNGNPDLELYLTGIAPNIADRVEALEAGAAPVSSTWSGKKLSALGDSITAQGRWMPALMETLGITIQNCGVSGTNVAYVSSTTGEMSSDARINAMDASSDALLFMGGVNDHGHDIPLGAITSHNVTSAFDNTTFYGALELVATKMLARFPLQQRIMWMTPTFADRSGTPPSGWPDGITNTLGLTIFDYAAATRAVAAKYGFPVIDLLVECGWNRLNIASYVGDDGGGLFVHPDAAHGGPRMSEVIIGRMRALEPLS